MTDFPPERPPRRSRPNHLAAPPLTQPQAAFEGLDVLAEIDGPAGVLLAGALRDVMLWVETAPADRAAAFGVDAAEHRLDLVRAAEIDGPVRVPLSTLAGMTGELERGGDNQSLLRACQEIESWADLQGTPATRLAFAQACALLQPHDAKAALVVARLARDLGETARAESWFRHVVRLSRHPDPASYGWAFIGLGVMFLRSGNYPAAHAAMVRALRHSERNRLREIAAASHHHLFHVATELGRLREAYAHVRSALGLYGKNQARLRDLAFDVGRFWVHQKEFRRALPVLEAAMVGDIDPTVRPMMTATIAYAAAKTGNTVTYEAARQVTEDCCRQAQGRIRLAETYLILAWAHLAARDWDRAMEAADRSAALAAANGEAENRLLAERALENAKAHDAQGGSAASDAETPDLARQAERLAQEVVQALSAEAD